MSTKYIYKLARKPSDRLHLPHCPLTNFDTVYSFKHMNTTTTHTPAVSCQITTKTHDKTQSTKDNKQIEGKNFTGHTNIQTLIY